MGGVWGMEEASYSSRWLDFLWAVGVHWYVLVTVVVLVIEPLIELVLPERARACLDKRLPRERRRICLITLSAALLVFACFQAYDDVNIKLMKTQLNTNNLNVVDVPSGTIYEAKKSDGYVIINTVPNKPTTIKLPATPQKGYRIKITDGNGYASTSAITVIGNGNTIDNLPEVAINADSESLSLIYTGTKWIIY
jgi:hypothetical protein